MQTRAMLLQRQTLKGMAHRMAQVERLADALLKRILRHHALLDAHRLLHQLLQLAVVGVQNVKLQQLRPFALTAQQAMLQHLRIARAKVGTVERPQKLRVDNHIFRRREDTHLVLQSVEVDARLAAHRSIHHRQQRCRDVDKLNATFEGSRRKTTQVGHHTAAQVDHQRVTRRPLVAQALPYESQRLQGLMHILRPNHNLLRSLQASEIADQRQTALMGMLIREQK